MSRREKQKVDWQSAVSTPMVVVAVVILVALLGWYGHRTLAPSPVKFPPKEQKQLDDFKAFVNGVVRSSGGDIRKVSAADMAKLNYLTRGMGDRAYQKAAQGRL
jgi:hypothetical protein